MQKDIFDVQLVKRSMVNGGHGKEKADKGDFGH